jgi:ribosomal RNA methyltransferase Nop2
VSIEENEVVVEHALNTRNVELVSFTSSVNFGVEGFKQYRERRFPASMNLTRRYYPHIHNMDGFFVAKFKKTSNNIPERPKKDRSHGTDHIKVWGEEHWTTEMMETVVDFTETKKPVVDETVGVAKAMNKRDRKKIKRAEQLRLRALASPTSSPTSAAKTPASGAAREPEEEPMPPAKRKLKKKKTPVKPEAIATQPEEPAAESVVRKKKKLVKAKKKSIETETKPEPEVPSVVRPKKKRKVAA